MPILDYVLRGKWGFSEDIEAHLNHLEQIELEMPSQEKCDIDYYEAPLITVCVNCLKSGIYLQPDQKITHPIYVPKLKVGLDYLLKSIDELPPNLKVNISEIVGDLEAFFRLKLLAADARVDDLVLDFFRKVRISNRENPTPLKSALFHRMIVLIYETADYHLLKHNKFRHALKLYSAVAEIPKEEIRFEHGEDISHDELVQINNVRMLTSQYLLLDEKLGAKQFYEAIANFRRRIQFDHLELLSSYIAANRLRTTGKDTDAQQKLLLWNITNQYFDTGKSEIRAYTRRHLSVIRNEVIILNLLLEHSLVNGFCLHQMTKPHETFKFGKLLAYYPELKFFTDLKKVFYTEGPKYKILNKCLATMHYYVKLMEMCLGEFEWPEKLAYYTDFDAFENSLPVSSGSDEPGHFSIMNIGHMNDYVEGRTIFEAITDEPIVPDYTEGIAYPYVFLKSFTTKVDDLNMWEMYGDSSRGVCVVMDSIKASTHYMLKKVCYLRNDAGRYRAYMEDNASMSATTISMINDILSKLSEEYTGFIKKGGDKEKIIPLMQSIAYLFKDASYAYEDEYRIMRIEDVDSPEIRYTAEKDGKLFVVDKERMYISGVVFGPKAENVGDRIPYLQYRCHFLSKELGMDDITIKLSSNEYITHISCDMEGQVQLETAG